MFTRTIFSFGAALALAAQPVLAQDSQQAEDEVLAAMAEMFTAEPLTPEQEARLPAAREVVERVMPPGAMAEMMQSTFGGFLDPLMRMGIEPSPAEVARELGIEDGGLEMSDEDAREAAAILDPAWTERREREFAAMKSAMSGLMETMEPAMRKGMAEAYAANFDAKELADVAEFFATPSGAAYARKSYALASDPRIMSAAMEGMPAMMQGFATMESAMEDATADLPPPRAFDDLTPEQRERLAEMTGLGEDAIADGMARAEQQRAEGGFALEP